MVVRVCTEANSLCGGVNGTEVDPVFTAQNFSIFSNISYVDQRVTDVNNSVAGAVADKLNGSGTPTYLARWNSSKTLQDSTILDDDIGQQYVFYWNHFEMPETFSIGQGAYVSGSQSFSLGANAYSGAPYSGAIGPSSRSDSSLGMAVGAGSIASGGTASMAIGSFSVAYGDYSMSIGEEAMTNSSKTVCIGYKCNGLSARSVLVGAAANSTGYVDALCLGFNCSVNGNNGVALGSYASAAANSIAAGTSPVLREIIR